MKKFISLILAVTVILSVFCGIDFSANAENANKMNLPISSDDISLSGTNAVGNMLAKEFEEEAEKQQGSGNVVTDVTVSGNEASVQLSTTVSCTLTVGIYTEDKKTMLTSASAPVTPQDETATVTFSENLPEYFYIKAYLIETENFAPVSAVYDSALYTEEMQTFLSKTTEDFEEEKVINFDNDETTNYAVLTDNVTRLDETGDKNELISADYEGDVYVFQNADEQLKNAKPNDIITNEYGDDFVIIKVASVSVSGNTVTVTGKEIDPEEVFDYLRVEETAGGIDTAELEREAAENTDNVMQYQPEPAPKKAPLKASGEVTHGGSATFTFTEKNLLNKQTGKFDCKIKFSGTLKFKAEAKVSYYITLKYYDISVKIDYSADITSSVSGSVKGYFGKIPTISLLTTGVVKIKIVPTFTPEFSGEINFTGRIKGTFGFKKTSDTDCQNLSSTPKLEAEIKGELKLFLGFELMPTVTFISKKICCVGIPVTIGAEGKGTLSYNTSNFLSESIHHDCISCLKGEIYGKLDISIEGEFLKNDKWKFKKTIVGVKVKVWDFYWSLDYKEFGFTTCPHLSYKLTVNVLDENGKAVKDATVNFNNKDYITDKNGSASAFLKNGKYTVTVTAKDYETESKSITVKDAPKTLNIKLSKEGSGSGGTTTNPDFKNSTLSLGGSHTGAITENGDLYMWGGNYYGQIGDGTYDDCYIPKKILSNVKSVSLGDRHSGAITENGDLYMWGYNYNGEIGDGNTSIYRTVPKKILSNVKSVSLGGFLSGAINENGDLYMWGANGAGQIGDGTTTDCKTPKKILSNVKSVSLGGSHSGAITENGDLYMWGSNYRGGIGDGTYDDCYTPKKILSNVKSVSLGGLHTGALTENGDLYMWGDNSDGKIGDGTKTTCDIPKKILSNVKSVSLGFFHSGAITENGDLYMWGSNYDGEMGDGTTIKCSTPKKILSGVKSVSLGDSHSGAITENGDLYMWGSNYYGQIGDGNYNDICIIPTKVTLPTAVKLSAPLKSAKLLSAEPENQSSFEGLMPNTVYNFYIMKDKKSETPFKTDNLFYIDQGKTDQNGNIAFNYAQQDKYSSAQKFVVAFENRLPDDVFADEIITTDKDTVYLHIIGAKFADYGFENVRAEFNINGVSAVSSDITVPENDYIISFKPQSSISEIDSITVTLSADYQNTVYTSKAQSVIIDTTRCGLNANEHKGGIATCKNKAICSECGREYGSVNIMVHTYLSATAGKCSDCGAVRYNGLVKINNVWYYYKNGVIDKTNTLVKHTDGKWYHVKDGKFNSSESATLVKYNGTWYYCNKGVLDNKSNTMVKYSGTWYHVKGGTYNPKETATLCKYNGTWYYCNKGVLDNKSNTMVKYSGAWYHVKGGTYNPKETATLVKYSGTWYYCNKGVLDNKSNTMVKYGGKWYHVKNGTYNPKETATLCKYSGTWYYCNKGALDNKSNTLVKYSGTWYHVKGGTYNPKEGATLVKYGGKWYYCKSGKVNFNYTGKVKYSGKTYKVVKGIKK